MVTFSLRSNLNNFRKNKNSIVEMRIYYKIQRQKSYLHKQKNEI